MLQRRTILEFMGVVLGGVANKAVPAQERQARDRILLFGRPGVTGPEGVGSKWPRLLQRRIMIRVVRRAPCESKRTRYTPLGSRRPAWSLPSHEISSGRPAVTRPSHGRAICRPDRSNTEKFAVPVAEHSSKICVPARAGLGYAVSREPDRASSGPTPVTFTGAVEGIHVAPG